MSTNEPASAHGTLYGLVAGFWRARALYAAAELRIADLIAQGITGNDELAEATGSNPQALYRLMRYLCSFGVFEIEDGRFRLGALGEALRSDVPGSMRAFVLFQTGKPLYSAWGDVVHSVRTGEEAFAHIFGMGVFEYNAVHPDHNRIFNDAMIASGSPYFEAVAAGYDFSGVKRIADVGGGVGQLLATILARYPSARGVLFDAPIVRGQAQEHVRGAGLEKRCEIVSGDFFQSVPHGCDVYMLSRIIHDWNDEKAIRILKSCRAGMNAQSRLLIIERIVPNDNRPSIATATDILMMVAIGGEERTEAEYRALLAAAGLRMVRVTSIAMELNIIEAAPEPG